jgi:hypothetical protein
MKGSIKPVEYLPPLYPIDGTAARVVSQKGETWEPNIGKEETLYRSEIAPPRLRKPVPGAVDLTGQTFGRLTVLGLSGVHRKNVERGTKSATWIARCSCGAFEGFRAKFLRGDHEARKMCSRCFYLEQVKSGTHLTEFERTHKHHARRRD